VSNVKSLEVDTSELRANDYNVNIVTPENEARLETSFDRFGIFKPIIVRQVENIPGYEIIGGEHRWHIARRRGIETVPIWNLGYIDDKTAKEISIADNARYGVDDTLSLADLLQELGDAEEIKSFLPYSDIDLTSIFSASDIELDNLNIDEDDEPVAASIKPDDKATRLPKTHTMMRFKVSIGDAERITKLITQAQSTFGFTTADDATNAGDALVHLLLTKNIEIE
jgi:ParB-like chromosome segregation protein Spo0J